MVHASLRITRKDNDALAKHKGKYLIKETKKDGVRFTTTELEALSRKHKAVLEEYEERQSDLMRKAIDIMASYTPAMEELNELYAELDVLVSLAHVSANAPIPYVRPVMKPRGEGNIVLLDARHPCLEQLDSVDFIPNDVRIERGASMLHIITGPNMGGKSTYIRQVGAVTTEIRKAHTRAPARAAPACMHAHTHTDTDTCAHTAMLTRKHARAHVRVHVRTYACA